MELGGNAPLIVYDDADLELALNVSVPTKYANAGQVCVTADRFFVHERLHDAFVEGFVARASALKVGDGLDPATQMGPLISRRRLEEIEGIVAEAVKAGATLASGGRRAAGFNAGPLLRTHGADRRHRRHAGLRRGELRPHRRDHPLRLGRRGACARQRVGHGPVGLRLHPLARSGRAARWPSSRPAWSGSTASPWPPPRRRSAARTSQAWGARAATEGLDAYLDTKLAQVVWLMPASRVREHLGRGQAGAQRLALDRQPLHRRDHGRAGLRQRDHRRAARRARLRGRCCRCSRRCAPRASSPMARVPWLRAGHRS